MKNRASIYLSLLGINLLYAGTAVFTKMASMREFLSPPYLAYIFGAVCVMGVYAFLWQQVLSRMPLSTAYMFKGTSLIFVLLFSVVLFGETITWTNILGSVIIIAGITLFAKA